MTRPGDLRAATSRNDQPDCATLLRALGDPSRLAMVEILLESPSHVSSFVSALDLEQSLVSHHLRVLRDAGLVRAERDGKSVLYSIVPSVGGSGRSLDLACCELVLRPTSRKSKKKSGDR